jgi:hypothetical protein
MRSFALVLPASLIFVGFIQGQALTENAAAAAGAAVGSGAGKSLSDSMTKIFGDTDKQTAKAAKPEAKKEPKPATTAAAPAAKSSTTRSIDSPLIPQSGSHSASQSADRAPRKPVLEDTTAATLSRSPEMMSPLPAPIAEPIVKVPTVQDIANIKVGTTANDLLTALGQPSSRVSIPDDDGHLRETCQYWANGRQIGTVRLDNGQVVTVETRPEN